MSGHTTLTQLFRQDNIIKRQFFHPMIANKTPYRNINLLTSVKSHYALVISPEVKNLDVL